MVNVDSDIGRIGFGLSIKIVHTESIEQPVTYLVKAKFQEQALDRLQQAGPVTSHRTGRTRYLR